MIELVKSKPRFINAESTNCKSCFVQGLKKIIKIIVPSEHKTNAAVIHLERLETAENTRIAQSCNWT